jgi:hypothetical protein
MTEQPINNDPTNNNTNNNINNNDDSETYNNSFMTNPTNMNVFDTYVHSGANLAHSFHWLSNNVQKAMVVLKWTSNLLQNINNGAIPTNWDYASNTATYAYYMAHILSNASINWDYASNLAFMTSQRVEVVANANVAGTSNASYASNLANTSYRLGRLLSNVVADMSNAWTDTIITLSNDLSFVYNAALNASNLAYWSSNAIGSQQNVVNVVSSASNLLSPYLTFRNNRVGIGTSNPMATLHLGPTTGTAMKFGNQFWIIPSDARLKTDIHLANIDECYSNVKRIPLKKYKWKPDVLSSSSNSSNNSNSNSNQLSSTLGWIAQDIEDIFPISVQKKNMFGYDDCRTFNGDQIYASMFGAVQKLQMMYEDMDVIVRGVQADMETVAKRIDDDHQARVQLEKIVQEQGLIILEMQQQMMMGN